MRLIIFIPEWHVFGRGRNLRFIEEITGSHYNALAIYLTFGIILAAFLYLETKQRRYLLIIPFFYYVTFLGGSRQGAVIPIAGLFVMYALVKGFRQVYKTIIALVLIVVLLIFFINSDLPGARAMLSLVNGFLGETGEVSFNERTLLREMAASMFFQKPVFGWGVNSFKAYLGHISIYLLPYSSHNTYLEILACLGVAGFIIYYSMHVRIIIQAVRRYSTKNLYAVFTLSMLFSVLLLEYGESLFHGRYGLASATALFCAFYSLKLSNQKPEENR